MRCDVPGRRAVPRVHVGAAGSPGQARHVLAQERITVADTRCQHGVGDHPLNCRCLPSHGPIACGTSHRLRDLIHDAIFCATMARDALGDIEHFVLAALLRLGGESYGVPILQEISKRTGRTVARSAVYIALRRLEAKGLVISRMGEATATRGGRAKRFFSVTKAGARQLVAVRTAYERMWANLQPVAERAAK